MIAFICGELAHTDAESVTIRVGGIDGAGGFGVAGGVGLRALVPSNVIQELGAVGDRVTLVTRLLVRDDRLELYGFGTERQAALFDQVQTVAGVGSRLALAILSTFTPDQFAAALENEDVAQLTRVSGLGKRTASRILLELRGKLTPPPDAAAASDDAADALAALGYSAAEIARVLARPEIQAAASVEERVAAALRQLGS